VARAPREPESADEPILEQDRGKLSPHGLASTVALVADRPNPLIVQTMSKSPARVGYLRTPSKPTPTG
jgi:hypothetical protein